MAGINQDVELLGRRFHVQTELTVVDRPFIRSVIFRAGQAVATRDRQIPPEVRDSPALQELVREHHRAVVASLQQRAQRVREQRLEETAQMLAVAVPIPVAASSTIATTPPPPAPPEEDLRLRRLLAELRQRLGISRAESRLGAGERLDHAARCFAWIVEHRHFAKLQGYEQLRFHTIRNRITGWEAMGRRADRARTLWTEILAFFDHLERLNERRSLIAHDRALAGWALERIERQGQSGQLRERLLALWGRQPQLDALLDGDPGTDPARWTAELQRIVAILDRHGAARPETIQEENP